MKTDLVLIGGGGHCKSCIDVIEATEKFNLIGIIDKHEKLGKNLMGFPYIGTDNELQSFNKGNVKFLITVGHIESPQLRIKLFNTICNIGGQLATVVSPLAYISKWANVDQGTIVMHNALINAGAQVGKNCIINTKALIEHDCIIGEHCHISTASVLNGNTIVGKGSFWGSNAVGKQSITLKENSFIKAGSCVKTQ